MAKKYGISRRTMDEFAALRCVLSALTSMLATLLISLGPFISHQKAVQAMREGRFQREIVPLIGFDVSDCTIVYTILAKVQYFLHL
jgi:hypothetical protein